MPDELGSLRYSLDDVENAVASYTTYLGLRLAPVLRGVGRAPLAVRVAPELLTAPAPPGSAAGY